MIAVVATAGGNEVEVQPAAVAVSDTWFFAPDQGAIVVEIITSLCLR